MIIHVDGSFIDVEGVKFLTNAYIKNNCVKFDKNVQIGGDVYHVVLDFDLSSLIFKHYVGKVVDSDELAFFYTVNFAGLLKDKNITQINEELLNSIDSVQNVVSDNASSILNSINQNTGSILGAINNLDARIVGVRDDLHGLNCNVDLTFIENKLSDIDNRLNLMQIVELEQKIDEKLGQLFHMPSLNGSNGAKYKDGEEVPIKGYNGLWRVEGSYPMLNADGVTIVVYKLTQNDRVLLAPSVFVGVTEVVEG